MVYFLLLINLYARFTRYEPWFISDINHISWIVFILAKFNFTKWLSISPRFQVFHQDDFNFTKSFPISPRVFRFHQESCALGEKNFTKMGGPGFDSYNMSFIFISRFLGIFIPCCSQRRCSASFDMPETSSKTKITKEAIVSNRHKYNWDSLTS